MLGFGYTAGMSDWINVLILAVVQGLTEFLPVSSSGHLAIGQRLLDFEQPGLHLEIFLHGGTLLAVLAYYRKRVFEVCKSLDWNYAVAIVLSMIPAAILGIAFKHQLAEVSKNIHAVGCCLIFTGVVLCAVHYLSPRPHIERVSKINAFLVGMAQGIAVLPGVSRSGMTISTARLLGIKPAQAAEFSFLMSVPVIGGALLLDIKDFLKEAPSADSVSVFQLIIGAAVAGVVGYFAILLINRLLNAGRFWWFGIYCLAVGALAVVCL